MPLRKLETLASKSLHKNPYWEYRLDNYTLPNGNVGEYHIVHTPGSTVVVPIHADGSLVLVRQFRYLWKKESLEFPCGGVKGGDYEATARAELAEEAQLAADTLRQIGIFNPFNGVTDEVCKVYLATGLTDSARERDESEEFEILKVSLAEFEQLAEEGKIWDGMALAAWVLARKSVNDYLKKENQ